MPATEMEEIHKLRVVLAAMDKTLVLVEAEPDWKMFPCQTSMHTKKALYQLRGYVNSMIMDEGSPNVFMACCWLGSLQSMALGRCGWIRLDYLREINAKVWKEC